ncbi:MAG: protoheme IX farnesyltransferase [Thermoproteota archaeon]|jgi:protoheme IX farnesyltransferase|uniref:Protoheme IX farnesyltransferase n=1 Tax=Candidatus Methanodesulfokora washburnensis TaxID=2478471 RepID=A0A3R9QBD6_9CREN|nr:heme o synthase [Candidatus Methanodesulfokores washburnensis]RSN72392.1 protoheme IX farnesyltransferase [Candidatus Methanodesulfokores washburnensis]TDA36989.1 MAG: protoheme IX farnesyltransferase [Candidatus Korarchaeota archaeon]
MAQLRDYIELTKPKQTFLLLLTSIFAYLTNISSISIVNAVHLIASMLLSISGTTAMNMALEADIDSLMRRTSSRPIPQGRLTPSEGLIFGIVLFLSGLSVSLLINIYVAVAVMLGLISDIFLYTLWLKRRNPMSIVLGGIAGGAPALAGWAASSGRIDLQGVLMALTVMLWIPAHIWYIAIYYKEDYELAGIPMLPVAYGVERTVKTIIAALSLLTAVELAMFVMKMFGFVFLILSLPFTLFLLYKSVVYLRDLSKEGARKMYKMASPLIGIIFIAMFIDNLVKTFLSSL